jgi:hypothetical protein
LSTDYSPVEGDNLDTDALIAEEDRLADLAYEAEAETIATGPDETLLGDQVEAGDRVRCPCGRLRRIWEDCLCTQQAREAYLFERVHGQGGFALDLNIFTPMPADRRVAGRRAA